MLSIVGFHPRLSSMLPSSVDLTLASVAARIMYYVIGDNGDDDILSSSILAHLDCLFSCVEIHFAFKSFDDKFSVRVGENLKWCTKRQAFLIYVPAISGLDYFHNVIDTRYGICNLDMKSLNILMKWNSSAKNQDNGFGKVYKLRFICL